LRVEQAQRINQAVQQWQYREARVFELFDYLEACGLSLEEIGRMLDAEMQDRRRRQQSTDR
jgi:hypothetical protein